MDLFKSGSFLGVLVPGCCHEILVAFWDRVVCSSDVRTRPIHNEASHLAVDQQAPVTRMNMIKRAEI